MVHPSPTPRLTISILTFTNQLSRNIASILQDQLRQVGIQLELNSLESATLFDRLAKAQFDLYYLIGIGSNQLTDVFQFVYHSRYQDPQYNDAIAQLRATSEPRRMEELFARIDAILNRGEYCPRLDMKIKTRGDFSNETAAKDYYLMVYRVLTDRGGQNRMRYCSPQVDQWIQEAERATDRAVQMDLYRKIQETVSEELPQIYLWYPANVLVASRRVGNIQLEPSGSWFFISSLTLDEN